MKSPGMGEGSHQSAVGTHQGLVREEVLLCDAGAATRPLPFADMIKKMMEAKKAGLPCDCAGMMCQIMQMCSGGKKTKEGSPSETKENPAAGQ